MISLNPFRGLWRDIKAELGRQEDASWKAAAAREATRESARRTLAAAARAEDKAELYSNMGLSSLAARCRARAAQIRQGQGRER